MALDTNEMFGSYDGRGAEIRLVQERNRVGTVAAQTGAPVLPKGTPMAFNTSTNLWTVFTQGGTNGTNVIRGLIGDADGVQSDATDEVQAIIVLAGEAHRDDINTAAIRAVLGGSPTEGNVDDALKAQTLRDAGIHIRGLAGVS